MIESGSLVPGVDPEAFGLPPHTACRYELPAAPLRQLISTYHLYDSDRDHHHGSDHWLLPSWPSIRFILAPDRIALSIGPRTYDPMPVAALYGTASRAMRMTTHGGITVGLDLSPIGWARFFGDNADEFRDRIVPLDSVLPPIWVRTAIERLHAASGPAAIVAVLDDMFLALAGPPTRDEPEIAALLRIINDDRTHDMAQAAEQLGMTTAALRRLATRYFGFPPKTLLIRTRFMRSLVRMLLDGDRADYRFMAPTYFDASHFLRDARRFLDMTPRRFMMSGNDYLVACLRARRIVLEAARNAMSASPVAPGLPRRTAE